jgi:dolichol-phosphate mannosyltransferase
MDDTAEVCAIHGVRHVRRSGGNQYGDAIRTGIAQARGTHLLCMDADGSHNASDFASMWIERERFDLLSASL